MTDTPKPIYTVHCVRSGDWWAVDVPEVPGIFTQSKRLDHVETVARDAIALMLDVEPDSFDVHPTWELPEDINEAMSDWHRAAEELADANSRMKEGMHDLAVLLVRQHHLTYRDAAKLLGVSHQRVEQLLKQAS
jgi:predicted RNase H-like HicB family nuclease